MQLQRNKWVQNQMHIVCFTHSMGVKFLTDMLILSGIVQISIYDGYRQI